MGLPLDERQQFMNASGKLAEMADIQWQALQMTTIPIELRREMMLEWWRNSFAPDPPDISEILRLLRERD